MNWIQKPWGWTACLVSDPDREFWMCYVLAGGFSSMHWHRSKHNRIYSRSAKLRVTIGTEFVTLDPGEHVDIPAGVPHRFEVLSSGSVWESYWGKCGTEDIVRLDSNGWGPL